MSQLNVCEKSSLSLLSLSSTTNTCRSTTLAITQWAPVASGVTPAVKKHPCTCSIVCPTYMLLDMVYSRCCSLLAGAHVGPSSFKCLWPPNTANRWDSHLFQIHCRLSRLFHLSVIVHTLRKSQTRLQTADFFESHCCDESNLSSTHDSFRVVMTALLDAVIFVIRNWSSSIRIEPSLVCSTVQIQHRSYSIQTIQRAPLSFRSPHPVAVNLHAIHQQLLREGVS